MKNSHGSRQQNLNPQKNSPPIFTLLTLINLDLKPTCRYFHLFFNILLTTLTTILWPDNFYILPLLSIHFPTIFYLTHFHSFIFQETRNIFYIYKQIFIYNSLTPSQRHRHSRYPPDPPDSPTLHRFPSTSPLSLPPHPHHPPPTVPAPAPAPAPD